MKKLHLATFLAVITVSGLIFSCFAANTNAGVTWTLQRVDTRVSEGSSSFAIDSKNNLHVSYSNYQFIEYTASTPSMINNSLWYATTKSSEWIIKNVDPNPIVLSSSLALDRSNNPHIAYGWKAESNASTALKYASYNGSAWKIQIVDSSAFITLPSLALDSNGYPHISYCNGTGLGSQLKYAYWNGTGWNIQIVDPTDYNVWGSSLTLDHNGNPEIVYRQWMPNMVQGTLKYAFWNGTNWTIQTAVANSPNLFDYSFALDSHDYPHIAYQWGNITEKSYALKYVSWNGSAWNTQAVNSPNALPDSEDYFRISLKIDNGNFPHVTYEILNATQFYSLEYAFGSGSGWSFQAVPSQYHIGISSLMLDSAGNPHIGYEDLYNPGYDGNLVYATAAEPIPSPTVPEFPSGILLSLFVVFTAVLLILKKGTRCH